ncbi:MAG TPA: C39 family peptidase [Candidatus Kapabacteria bacterium]
MDRPIVQGEYAYIQVIHKEQAVNMCVPTSASMILAYYGDKDISPQSLKQLSTPINSDFDGTYLRDLINGVRSLGYNWELRVFPVDSIGFENGFREIRQTLDNGNPILLSTSFPPIGHTLVMVGYDTIRREIFLVDPGIEAPGRRTLTYTKFNTIWHDDIADCRAFVLTKPKSVE